jgi:hypothetical protein
MFVNRGYQGVEAFKITRITGTVADVRPTILYQQLPPWEHVTDGS